MSRKYLWRPGTLDRVNNYRYRHYGEKVAEPPPAKMLINTPTEWQIFGDCVSEVITTHLEAEIMEARGIVPPPALSVLFAYYQYREKYGEINEDNGASIFYEIKVLMETGICRSDLWPYIESRFSTKPPQEAYQDAQNYRIASYWQLDSVADMVNCIASGHGLVFGIPVYESFESQETEDYGRIRVPKQREKFLGGHALYACGYDLKARAFQIQNSWGSEWAGKSPYPGHGWLPFDYMTEMGQECFTLRIK